MYSSIFRESDTGRRRIADRGAPLARIVAVLERDRAVFAGADGRGVVAGAAGPAVGGWFHGRAAGVPGHDHERRGREQEHRQADVAGGGGQPDQRADRADLAAHADQGHERGDQERESGRLDQVGIVRAGQAQAENQRAHDDHRGKKASRMANRSRATPGNTVLVAPAAAAIALTPPPSAVMLVAQLSLNDHDAEA